MREIEIVNLQSGVYLPWFNDPVEMAKCVQSLDGLNKLTQARGEYGEFRPAPLNRMVLAGLWFADNFGQTSPAGIHPMGGPTLSVGGQMQLHHVTRDRLVQTPEAFAEQFRPTDPEFSWGHSFGSGRFMPSAGMRCTHCKKPWAVDDSADAYISDKDAFVVLDAQQQSCVGKTLAEVREIITQAQDENGIAELVMRRYEILKSPRFVDKTLVPKYKDSLDMVEKNPEGWACSDKVEQRMKYIDWNTYVVQAGDVLYFDKRQYIHLACRTEVLNVSVRTAFGKALSGAGVMWHGSVSIPNMYTDASYSGRWFLFETTHGLFRLGWRRHVISLLEMENGKMEYAAASFTQKPNTEDKHFNNCAELERYLREKFNPTTEKGMIMSNPKDLSTTAVDAVFKHYDDKFAQVIDLSTIPEHMLTAEQLDERYNPDGDGEHPIHTRSYWIDKVNTRNLLIGYWDWVVEQLQDAARYPDAG